MCAVASAAVSRATAARAAAIARRGLLGVLHAAVAGRRQVRVALVVLLGEGVVGLVDVDRRPGRVDDRLLRVELGLLAGDGRLAASTSALA